MTALTATAELCRQWQSEFVAGFEAKLAARGELPLPGGRDIVSLGDLRRTRLHFDQIRAMRRAVADSGGLDRALLDRLPVNPTVVVRYSRRGLFRETPILAAAAVTLSDLDALASGEPAGPVDPARLHSALASLPADEVPAVVGVFSPGGWTAEAIASVPEDTRLRVVLVARTDEGTWQVFEAGGRTTTLADLFDPEPEGRKIARIASAVRTEVDRLPSAEALHAADIAKRLRVPARLVSSVLEDFARRHSHVRLIESGASAVMYRFNVPALEPTLMQRLWPFSRDPAHDLEALAERRMRLILSRRKTWDELDTSAAKEAEFLAAGIRAETEGARRRLAVQLVGVRRELRHRRRLSEVMDRQIDILSSHLHNLELVALAEPGRIPPIEEIQAAADKAQQVITDLAADWQTAEQITAETAVDMPSDDIDAILREFEQARDAELDRLVVHPTVEPARTEPTEPVRVVEPRPRRMITE